MEYKMTIMRFQALILSILFCALTAGAAETIPFTVNLSTDQAVPRGSGFMYGEGFVFLTGDTLVFQLGLREVAPFVERNPRSTNRPPAIVLPPLHVRMHGPAPAGSNAQVLFDLGTCGAGNAIFTVATVIIAPNPHPPTNTPPPPPVPPSPGPPPPCDLGDVTGISPAVKEALFAGLLYVEAEGLTGRMRGQILPADSDADGVPDYLDWCPNTLPDTLVNRDGCSLDHLVPCDGPWKNHGQFAKAFKDATKSFVEDGLITKKTKHELDKEAQRSDCGKKR